MTGSIIAVGVDGSEGSHRALRWAVAEAVLRGATVEVVTAWPPRGGAVEAGPDQEDQLRRRADETQRHVISTVLAGVDDPPPVSREVVRGDAIDVLVQASAHADLIVVGSHGVSGLRHAALGSVSEACARLAACPSVVVPVPPPEGRGTEVTVV